MEDWQIIDLYRHRDNSAIPETARKYGPFCRMVARSILQDGRSARKCMKDTYEILWNTVPSLKPEQLQMYILRTTRNVALDTFRTLSPKKQAACEVGAVMDEIVGYVPGVPLYEDQEIIMKWLLDKIDHVLGELPEEDRVMFVQRYWYMLSVKDIARETPYSEHDVEDRLLRARTVLLDALEAEEVPV